MKIDALVKRTQEHADFCRRKGRTAMAQELALAAQVIAAQDKALRVFRATAALVDPDSAKDEGDPYRCEHCGGEWEPGPRGARLCGMECRLRNRRTPA